MLNYQRVAVSFRSDIISSLAMEIEACQDHGTMVTWWLRYHRPRFQMGDPQVTMGFNTKMLLVRMIWVPNS